MRGRISRDALRVPCARSGLARQISEDAAAEAFLATIDMTLSKSFSTLANWTAHLLKHAKAKQAQDQ